MSERYFDTDGLTVEEEDMLEKFRKLQSVHVHIIAWCMCCNAEVDFDHLCACELPDADGATAGEKS
jgi:hypothetical protein